MTKLIPEVWEIVERWCECPEHREEWAAAIQTATAKRCAEIAIIKTRTPTLKVSDEWDWGFESGGNAAEKAIRAEFGLPAAPDKEIADER